MGVATGTDRHSLTFCKRIVEWQKQCKRGACRCDVEAGSCPPRWRSLWAPGCWPPPRQLRTPWWSAATPRPARGSPAPRPSCAWPSPRRSGGSVRHPDGRPEVLAATLPTLGDGSYLAGWRIVSADDGHLEAGSFAFAVGTGSGPVTSPAPSQLPTPWQVAGRWLETAGVLGLVGVVVAALAIWDRPEPIGPDEPRWWALTVAAAAVGAVGLAWQVAAGAATVSGLGPGAVGAFLSASPATGRRLLVELVLLGATAALVWWRVRNGRRPGLGALALAAGAVVTLALGAHDTGLAPRWLFLPLAVVARFRLLPRASADAVAGETPGGLRRLLAIEATGGAVVVLVAALLANTVPAGEVLAAASAARVRGGVQAQQLEAGPLRLQVGLEPGTVGRNLLQVQVTDPSGRLVDGLARIDLTIADQAGRAAPASVRATRVAPATYRAATDAFALPGGWRVGVAVPGAAPGLAARFAIAAAPATSGTPPPDPPDALVLGGRAGSALVGLTAMAAGSVLVVRVRGGLGIPPAVAPRPLRVRGPDGHPLAALVQPCGDGCAEAFLTTPAGGSLAVEAVLPNKGTARFALPWPLARPAPGRLRAADRALAASRSFRIHEVLDGGLGTVYRTDYVLAAPSRFRSHTASPASSGDVVWIANDRWIRDGAGPWKHEHTPGLEIRFPARNWSDQEGNVVDLGPASWHGVPVEVLAFVDANVAYHRLWVDHANRILHERMDAPGHFMDRDYTAYGASVTITAPQ